MEGRSFVPLTHVCIWSESHWKRITAQEAAQDHPGGTVHARSGLFMCEQCHQYVAFTDGPLRDRYFKHSAEEKSKDCPERTFTVSKALTFSAGSHSLPIKIRILSRNHFSFELGFIAVPDCTIGKRDNRKIIIYTDNDSLSFTYSFSRLESQTTTYLPVGDSPSLQYKIELHDSNSALHEYWPSEIEGIDSEGAVFDADTGKKLPSDADVTIDQNYYILTNNQIWGNFNHIKCSELCRVSIHWTTWYIYNVIANDLNEETARFFLQYHCRLTDKPIKLYPIWPICILSPYMVLHSEDRIYFYLQGDATPKVFPYTLCRTSYFEMGKLIHIECKDRQQILSAGRAKVLRYTYLWKENLNKNAPLPEATVCSDDGELFAAGIIDKLPPHRAINISVPFDGFVLVKRRDLVISKIKLNSASRTRIDSITVNSTIEIFIGCDCAWRALYVKKPVIDSVDDKILWRQLVAASGNEILIPHSIGAIIEQLHEYPLVNKWLYKAVRRGRVPRKAMLLLYSTIERKGWK
jgi:hypothetical protein